MTQTLNDKINGLEAFTPLNLKYPQIPDYILDNLKQGLTLRPYQMQALRRFFFYLNDYPHKPIPIHLLYHMATGSGKTVIMASLILELYNRGYRNFIFFVNSSNIIQKTKDN